jgi:hypothetical protein
MRSDSERAVRRATCRRAAATGQQSNFKERRVRGAMQNDDAHGNIRAVKLAIEDRTTLDRLEESLWRDETRFDYKFMDEVVGQDFFEFGRSGRIYERADTLSAPRQPIDAILPLPNLKIRLLNQDTAQVTYDSIVKRIGVVDYGRRSSIWTRTEKGWGLRFHQGTPYLP